jgi:hypothetical protein
MLSEYLARLGMQMFHRFLLLAAASLLLAACVTQPTIEANDGPAIQDSPPPPGKARVYVYGARTFWNSFEVFVDNVDVGGLNAGEAMALDIPPGHHTLVHRVKNVWGGMNEPISTTVDLVPGQKVYVEAYLYTGPIFLPGVGGGFVGGAVAGAAGYLANKASEPATPHEPGEYFEAMPQGGDDVKSKTFVLPDPKGIETLNKAPTP